MSMKIMCFVWMNGVETTDISLTVKMKMYTKIFWVSMIG